MKESSSIFSMIYNLFKERQGYRQDPPSRKKRRDLRARRYNRIFKSFEKDYLPWKRRGKTRAQSVKDGQKM